MAVEINDILHVLAHELRTPVGIAHGYVRLLLEDRLAEENDRKRALEQMQRALARLTALSNETTALAAWYEQPGNDAGQRAGVRGLIDRIVSAAYESQVIVDVAEIPGSMTVRTTDAEALGNALIDVVRATARELRGQPCNVSVRIQDHRLEVLAGRSELLAALAAGPFAADAGPLALERGGLGLALVHAVVVLDAHSAERWALKCSRHAAGIRLSIEEEVP